jgi:hypothetical protein
MLTTTGQLLLTAPVRIVAGRADPRRSPMDRDMGCRLLISHRPSDGQVRYKDRDRRRYTINMLFRGKHPRLQVTKILWDEWIRFEEGGKTEG